MKPKIEQKKTLVQRTLSVYGYTCFRAYLRDFYLFRKDSYRGYSYRAFSKAAGFTSPNLLKLVIDNKRNISPAAIKKFIVALGLKTHSAEYFETLVRMNQAKSDEDKEYYFQVLEKQTPQSKKRELEKCHLEYMGNWLMPVIREMVSLDEFRDDPYWLSRRIQGDANVADIKKALNWLLSQGFITKNGNHFEATDNMVLSSDEVKSLAIRKYHRNMLDMAKERLESLPIEQREFSALTIILPENALDELKYKMKQFRKDLHAWALQTAEDQGGEIVVQTNFQMYPHTKKVS